MAGIAPQPASLLKAARHELVSRFGQEYTERKKKV